METPRTSRDILDEPPKEPKLRRGPRVSRSSSKLSSLAGSNEPDDSDEALNTPEGEGYEADGTESTEMDSHPVVQAFSHLGQAKAHLEILGTIMPPTMLVVQDLINTLEQIVPQIAASMVSGTAMNPAMGAGTAMGPAAGGPPMMGLQQLAGSPAVGAQAGPPMTPGLGVM